VPRYLKKHGRAKRVTLLLYGKVLKKHEVRFNSQYMLKKFGLDLSGL
jgi:hypothetical protein